MENQINVNKILDYIKANNLSKTEFCKNCNMSVSTLNAILTNKNFKLTAIFKIARAMTCHIKDMFIK